MKIHRSLTAVAVVAVLALSGCGDEDNKDSKDATSSESKASNDDKDVEKGDEVDKEDFLDDVRDGIENTTTAHMKMSMTAAGQQMSGEADIDYRGDTPTMAMQLTGGMFGKDPVDIRLIEGVMYMQAPGLGGKFIAIDLSDPDSPLAGAGFDDLSKMMDPGSAFEQYADGLEEVQFLGDEEINGTDTKHYKVLIDTSKVESLKDLPAGANVPDTIEYEMWLDDENRMRRTVVDLADSPVTIDVTDYGKDVDIKKPAKSEIVDMPKS